MVTERADALDAAPQFRPLGICWVLYGIFLIATAVWLMFFEPTATLMFGALLNRVPDPFTMMDAFHLFYSAAVIFYVACGALGIAAGGMLAAGRRPGRLLGNRCGILLALQCSARDDAGDLYADRYVCCGAEARIQICSRFPNCPIKSTIDSHALIHPYTNVICRALYALTQPAGAPESTIEGAGSLVPAK